MDKQSPGFTAKAPRVFISFFSLVFILTGYYTVSAQQQAMMVRIAEIELVPTYLNAYKAILQEEAAASIKREPGVISIFPMYQQEDSTQVRILEIYASKAAYEQHLKTAHFQRYKTTTLNMVKSVKLVNMKAIDTATMSVIFRKLTEDKR